MTQTIVLSTASSYRPPKGYRVIEVRLLSNGTAEVTIEPWEPIR